MRNTADKNESARVLADAHRKVEPGISRIARVVADREFDVGEPVKLLEVNPETSPSGIFPIAFGPEPPRFPFPSVVIEVTEFERIRAGSLPLPDGWRLGETLYPSTTSSMTTRSQAFATQAGSDLDAYELLARSTLPVSHRLHYLQMWLEKLCKAYLWNESQTAPTTHNIISKVLPRLISEHWRRIGFERPPEMTQIRELCREVDLLHPQVDDGGRRPDNVEYPWAGSSGGVEIPAHIPARQEPAHKPRKTAA